jgi:hypothetical protein
VVLFCYIRSRTELMSTSCRNFFQPGRTCKSPSRLLQQMSVFVPTFGLRPAIGGLVNFVFVFFLDTTSTCWPLLVRVVVVETVVLSGRQPSLQHLRLFSHFLSVVGTSRRCRCFGGRLEMRGGSQWREDIRPTGSFLQVCPG